jgi:His/Glu/Gln/Arg/opine family amino acid ABC transporter permease subunit
VSVLSLLAYTFNWEPVRDRWEAFALGAWLDVWLTALSFLFACLLGIAIALMRLSGVRVLSAIAFAYVQVLRGVPLLVMLYWVYFGIAIVVNLNFTSVQAAIIALSLTGSAYTAETFRAAISGVDPGHGEAATALGFTRRATFRHIIFPQAFRIAVPPLGNTFIGLLKGATLISVIGVADMVFVAQEINLSFFTPFEPFTAVALILVSLVAVFSVLVATLERLLRLP